MKYMKYTYSLLESKRLKLVFCASSSVLHCVHVQSQWETMQTMCPKKKKEMEAKVRKVSFPFTFLCFYLSPPQANGSLSHQYWQANVQLISPFFKSHRTLFFRLRSPFLLLRRNTSVLDSLELIHMVSMHFWLK